MTELHTRLENSKNEAMEVFLQVKQQIQELESKINCWNELEEKMKEEAEKSRSKVILDIGGERFHTSRATLLKYENCYFSAMLLSDEFKPDSTGAYFIDRNPRYFAILLDYLRTNEIEELQSANSKGGKIQKEFQFYGIPFPKIIKYTFSNGQQFAVMRKAYLVNKGTLLHSGKHKWTVRVDNLVAPYDLGVVCPFHTSHFNYGTPTAWGIRDNGNCLWSRFYDPTKKSSFTSGDILTFYLDLDEGTLQIEVNGVEVQYIWNNVVPPVHLAFSGGAGASATIISPC